MRKRLLSGESGVAMVTVLFVGAALTAVASAAAFTAVREMQAGGDDRRASEAVSIAEAGIDRFVEYVKSGEAHWGELRLAGCDEDHPPVVVNGQLGPGRTFQATFEVYNPNAPTATERFAPAACVASAGNERHPSPKVKQFFAITSIGRAPAASRVIRQVVQIESVGLPIGVYADGVDMNGNPNFAGVSFLSQFDVEGREKMAFSGIDPYYTLNDFWPGMSDSLHMPASIQSMGKVYLKKLNQENSIEHTPTQPRNCTANQSTGTRGQSLWDQSATGGSITSNCPAPNDWAGPPVGSEAIGPDASAFPYTSKMTEEVFKATVPQPALSDQDYLALKSSAQQQGLYCFIPTTGNKQCSRAGVSWTGKDGTTSKTINVTPSDVAHPGVPMSHVAYFEYEDASQAYGSNNVIYEQNANVWPCSDDLDLHRSTVIIIRNGSYGLGTGSVNINGLMVVPEGEVRFRGGHHFQGTIIAQRVNLQGNAMFANIPCWVRNMPGPFLSVLPTQWSEVDRP